MSPWKIKTPQEKIIRTDVWTMIRSAELQDAFLKNGKRIAELACGHKCYTNALERCHCPRCQQMLESGFDWDGFRNLRNVRDDMVWPEDPCRTFNEPTDLAGNFLT